MAKPGTIIVPNQRAAYELDIADGVVDGKYHGQEIGVTAPGTYAQSTAITASAPALAPAPPLPAPIPAPIPMSMPMPAPQPSTSFYQSSMVSYPPIITSPMMHTQPMYPKPVYMPPPILRSSAPPMPLPAYRMPPPYPPMVRSAPITMPHPWPAPPLPHAPVVRRKYCNQTWTGEALPCTCAHAHTSTMGIASTTVMNAPMAAPILSAPIVNNTTTTNDYSYANGNVVPVGGNAAQATATTTQTAVAQGGTMVNTGAWEYANGVGIAGGNHNFNYRPLHYDNTPIAPDAVRPHGSLHPLAFVNDAIGIKPFRAAEYSHH